MIEIFVL
jgi:hypothetical protein